MRKRARYVIAIDGYGVYLRRTLCVTHRMENGEAQYDTKPISVSKAPKHIQKMFRLVADVR